MFYHHSAPDEKRIQISETEFILQSECYTKYVEKIYNKYSKDFSECYHRLGGLPALEHSTGDKWYYEHGIYHRENDLPAIDTRFVKQWMVNGKYYRKDNQPTSIQEDSIFYHDENEDFHCLTGPAVIYLNLKEEWYYVRGYNLTLNEKVRSVEDLTNYLNKQILL